MLWYKLNQELQYEHKNIDLEKKEKKETAIWLEQKKETKNFFQGFQNSLKTKQMWVYLGYVALRSNINLLIESILEEER